MKNLRRDDYDLVVVGGGLSGLCAAIAAARHGLRSALVHDRPVLGGNASSEVRMHICGADRMGQRENARETGILEEIQEENRAQNPGNSWSIWDTVMWEKAHFQNGLDLFLNAHCDEVTVDNGRIISVSASQLTSETRLTLGGRLFVDATGDGTVGFLAGAEYMSGREGKSVFGESLAPDEGDDYTMGNSLLFRAVDAGKPVEFRKPFWANTYSEEDLRLRDHSEITAGYWWIELGGKELDTIDDAEEIRDELLKALFGIWDHIKNGGPDGTDHGAANLALEWVGFLPGKRESRRFVGDYVLTERDLTSGVLFEDTIAYGGWALDLHAIGGLQTTDEEPCPPEVNRGKITDLYKIPYRCIYSKNIDNLFLGGRTISVSHVAFGATRQMATCAAIGQVIGIAAAMAVETGISPRGVLAHVKELQQRLLKDDCYIPGSVNQDEKDLARRATVRSSSAVAGGEPENIINGVSRKVGSAENAWISRETQGGEWIELTLAKPSKVAQVRLTYDPNLSREIKMTLSDRSRSRQRPGIPRELVEAYDLEFYEDDRVISSIVVVDNYLRHRVHVLDEPVTCDRLLLRVNATRGDHHARVFEIRVYE